MRTIGSLLPTACSTLKDWNLLVNESKAEFTHIYLANADQKDNGKAVCGNEQWCNSRSLGSCLCSSTDVLHRCSLGTAAFHSLWATPAIDATLYPSLGICRPHTISNELLYRRCDTQPPSETVTEACWRMLGHVLRMSSNTPAQLAMQFALEGATKYQGRHSCHQTNLLETI